MPRLTPAVRCNPSGRRPPGYITGRRPQQPGSRSRRLGHRGNQGPADQLHQDRRHRRSGPLHGARAAGRDLQRVGPRLRPRRFDADPDEAGRDCGHADARRRRTRRRKRRRSIPATTGCRCSSRRRPSEFPGTGPQGNGVGPNMLTQNHLDQLAQVGLQLLSSARQPADPQRRPRAQGEAGAEDARRGVGMAPRHRRSRHVDVRRADQPGQGTIAQGLRRLDRAHRQGRSAAGAAAAERHRAQPRGDAVGRRRRPLVHARRSLDRQEPSRR